MNLKIMLTKKKEVTETFTQYNSIYVMFQNRQNFENVLEILIQGKLEKFKEVMNNI